MTKYKRHLCSLSVFRALVVTSLLCCFVIQIPAQTSSRTNGGRLKTPAAKPNGKTPVSEMRSAIERYTVDRGSLQRSYPVAISRSRRERFKKFYEEWLSSLQSQDFDSMSQDGKIDYILFKTHLEYELRQLDIQSRQMTEIEPLVPFGAKIVELEEARRRMEPIDSAKIAATLNDLRKQVDERRRAIELGLRDTNAETGRIKKTVGNRAVAAINGARPSLISLNCMSVAPWSDSWPGRGTCQVGMPGWGSGPPTAARHDCRAGRHQG